MHSELGRLDGVLLTIFTALFAVVAVASILPTRPVLWLFPLWSVVVLAAVVVVVVAATVAVVWFDWPHRHEVER